MSATALMSLAPTSALASHISSSRLRNACVALSEAAWVSSCTSVRKVVLSVKLPSQSSSVSFIQETVNNTSDLQVPCV